jgi:phage gp29-like protein
MVVMIVLIVSVAGVLRTLFGGGGGRKAERIMRQVAAMQPPPQADPEAARLREDVRGLKERVAVLERLITDQSSSLDREFEKLKQMD